MAYNAEKERKILSECKKILKHKTFGEYSAETQFDSRDAFVNIVKKTEGDVRGICCLFALDGFEPLNLFYPINPEFKTVDYANDLGLCNEWELRSVRILLTLVRQLVYRAHSSKNEYMCKRVRRLLGARERLSSHLQADIEVMEVDCRYNAPFALDSKSLLSPVLTRSKFRQDTAVPSSNVLAICEAIMASHKPTIHAEASPTMLEYACSLFDDYVDSGTFNSKEALLRSIYQKDKMTFCTLMSSKKSVEWITPALARTHQNFLKSALLYHKAKFPRAIQAAERIESLISSIGKPIRKEKREKGAPPKANGFHIMLHDDHEFGGRWLRVKMTGPFGKSSLTLAAIPVGTGRTVTGYSVDFGAIKDVISDSRIGNRFCTKCGSLEKIRHGLSKQWQAECDEHAFEEFE